jgi:hypothetical protein
MKHLIQCLLAAAFVATASAQENPLAKCSVGDWAKYLITTKNETVPLMSGKDRPVWLAVRNADKGFVYLDNYSMWGKDRHAAGGSPHHPARERFEPVPDIAISTPVEIVSTSKEALTINGARYECTKIVRRIDQPLDDKNLVAGWKGTSTLWISDKLPLGLARMENVCDTKSSRSDKGQKITETWVIAEFGFKNWK